MSYAENQNKLIDAIQEVCPDMSLIKTLMENVKDPDLLKWATKEKKMSPIGACIRSGNMEILDMLLAYGAPLTIPDWGPDFTHTHDDPLEVAIKTERLDMVSKLLEVGAFRENVSYICLAMFQSDRELHCFRILMNYLVDMGPIEDCFLFPTLNGNCPFKVVMECMYHQYWKKEHGYHVKPDDDLVADIVEQIVDLGFPLDTYVMSWSGLPECPDPVFRYTTVKMAFMNHHVTAAVKLIKAGCSVREKDSDELLRDILWYSIFLGYHQLIRILVLAGAKIMEQHLTEMQKVFIWMDNNHCKYESTLELAKWMSVAMCNPHSLKNQCTVMIRDHLREVTNHRTILPIIEQLPIPVHMKQYLSLEIQ